VRFFLKIIEKKSHNSRQYRLTFLRKKDTIKNHTFFLALEPKKFAGLVKIPAKGETMLLYTQTLFQKTDIMFIRSWVYPSALSHSPPPPI